MNVEKKYVTDRELLSELFENQIHPLQIHMVPPFVDENSPIYCKNWTYLPVILVKLLLGVNIRANIFRMEKQNITISNECSGFRAQFYSPRSEFIYDIIEISHALK